MGKHLTIEPTSTCPFFSEWDGDDLFCLGCINLVRESKSDRGSIRRGNAQVAYSCKVDGMKHAIYYVDYEPVMSWE